MTVVNQVKDYLFESGIDIKDHELNRLYRMTEQAVLSYCNLSSLPKGLEPVALDMMITSIEAEQKGAGSLDDLNNQNLKSVSIGRVSYTYEDSESNSLKSVESIVHDYKSILNKYRRLNW